MLKKLEFNGRLIRVPTTNRPTRSKQMTTNVHYVLTIAFLRSMDDTKHLSIDDVVKSTIQCWNCFVNYSSVTRNEIFLLPFLSSFLFHTVKVSWCRIEFRESIEINSSTGPRSHELHAFYFLILSTFDHTTGTWTFRRRGLREISFFTRAWDTQSRSRGCTSLVYTFNDKASLRLFVIR